MECKKSRDRARWCAGVRGPGGMGPLKSINPEPPGDQLRHSLTPLSALRGTVADTKCIVCRTFCSSLRRSLVSRPLAAMSSKNQREKRRLEKLKWIGELSDQDEDDMSNTMERWAAHIKAKGGWEAGRWRQTKILPYNVELSAKDKSKFPGALWLRNRQWNLFYYKGDGPTIQQIVQACDGHPFFGVGRWETVKDESHLGKWQMDIARPPFRKGLQRSHPL